ncbi:MAG: glutamate-1-semialdehyde 2,1-aminomutase [bacterium]
MNIAESERLWADARRLMPGGVNSPVRAFGGVGGTPRFIERGEGAYLYDVDGNRYVDYMLSWGPLVLGHAHPRVVEALHRAVRRGTSYGAPTPLEVEIAQVIIDQMPSIELLRLVNSGTEATMSAIRLARAFTGRDKVVKFAGGYHGHADAFLVQAGSGVSTFGLPDSPGVTAAATSDTLTAAFNDLGALEDLFGSFPGQIAAVIAEPLMANMGFIMPRPGFLAGIQELCRKSGALFILDEVITGFRLGIDGAQGVWGLEPDLTCLGKVIGGGLPLGAYGGKRAIMEMVAPAGPVYQAGTLSGNPLATTAGLATLRTLLEPGAFAAIEGTTRKLAAGIGELAKVSGIPLQVGQSGTIFGFYFLKDSGAKIGDASSAKSYADTQRYSRFFHLMLEQGVYFAPSQFEVAFTSAAHGESQVEATLRAVEASFRRLADDPGPGG